ncbi:MAG: hypothetical protein LBQ54_01325 [Planctomycetaceae bacterium]|jgi:hypothetical protein|nr:hypothetical protein [Planctomycetaceae bacterium]
MITPTCGWGDGRAVLRRLADSVNPVASRDGRQPPGTFVRSASVGSSFQPLAIRDPTPSRWLRLIIDCFVFIGSPFI